MGRGVVNAAVAPPPAWTMQRIRALDVFRGAAVVAMILVNNPGSADATWSFLRHAPWAGWTFADTIFPAFLWIVGVGAALSIRRRQRAGATRGALLQHAVVRTLVLVAAGLLLEGFPTFTLVDYQVTGVLQKIAITYLLATCIALVTDWRGRSVAIVVIVAVYLVFMTQAAPPGCIGHVWSPDCNAARTLDERLLAGHTWIEHFGNDPDGIVGTLVATATVLLGMIAGDWLLCAREAGAAVYGLFAGGIALVVGGLAASAWVPINKVLWTPSYLTFMAGLSMLAFAACLWVVDVRRVTRWGGFFEIFGKNALVAYMLSRIGVDGLKLRVHGAGLYRDVLERFAPPAVASFLFAAITVMVVFAFVYWMYRRSWFVKL